MNYFLWSIITKITKNFQQEPRSEANIEDVTSFLSSSVKAADDILSGDALSFITDAGKAISDFQNMQNESKTKKNIGQQLTQGSKDATPYYMKPGDTDEPIDQGPNLPKGVLGARYGITAGIDGTLIKPTRVGDKFVGYDPRSQIHQKTKIHQME